MQSRQVAPDPGSVFLDRPVSGHVFRVARKAGPVWYAKYRGPDGRQVQKKLGPAWTQRGRPDDGFFTKREAEAWLAATLDAVRAGDGPDRARPVLFAEAAAGGPLSSQSEAVALRTARRDVRPYRVPAMGAVCEIDACGVLATGRCAACTRAFCQSHQAFGLPIPEPRHDPVTALLTWSVPGQERWLVDKCACCYESEADARRKRAEAQAQSDRARLAAIEDPIELYLTVVRRSARSADGFSLTDPAVNEARSSVPNGDDFGTLARWFVGAAKARGRRPNSSHARQEWRRNWRGKRAWRSLPEEAAWCLRGCVSKMNRYEQYDDVFIFEDGSYSPESSDISGRAHYAMAEILDLG